MNQQDFPSFCNAWADAHEAMAAGKVLSSNAMAFCFDTLAKYPLDAVLLAITKHCQQNRFAPTPADICDLLEFGNHRLSADEMLAEIPRSEADSVVWTKEAASAYAVASEMILSGDWYNEARAFKAAYERECKMADLQQCPVKLILSLGTDPAGREVAIKKAVTMGAITQAQADRYLLPPSKDGGPIGKLLTGQVVEMPNANAALKSRWGDIKQSLADGNARAEATHQAHIRAERDALEARAAALVAQMGEEKIETAKFKVKGGL